MVIIDRNMDRKGWKCFLSSIIMNSLNLKIRVSDGSVFSVDAGFQIHLGQAEEFPLLEVCDHSFLKPHLSVLYQANHISISPGRKHNIELQGTHITTSKEISPWKFEGNRLS